MPFRLAAFALALCLPAFGASAFLNGRVVDRFGAPVEDASIMLTAQSGAVLFRTATNVDGEFFFTGIPPGAYFIEARLGANASPQAFSIELGAGQNRDITLVIQPVANAPKLNVVAAAQPEQVELVPKDADAVSVNSAVARGLLLPSQALAYTPIREGSGVLIDGTVAGRLPSMFLTGIANMEVERGSAATLYGNEASAGVIALSTASGGGGPFHGDVDLQGGTDQVGAGAVRFGGGLFDDRLSYTGAAAHWNGEGLRIWNEQAGAQYSVSPSTHAAFDFISASDFRDAIFRWSQVVDPSLSYRISYANVSGAYGMQDLNASLDYWLGSHQNLLGGYQFTSDSENNSPYLQDAISLFSGKLRLLLSGRLTQGDAALAYYIARTGTKFRSHVGKGEQDAGIDEYFWGKRLIASVTAYHTRLGNGMEAGLRARPFSRTTVEIWRTRTRWRGIATQQLGRRFDVAADYTSVRSQAGFIGGMRFRVRERHAFRVYARIGAGPRAPQLAGVQVSF